MRKREDIEKVEDEQLAPWAVRSRESAGRIHAESEHAYRTAFQRDRDRILHSTAFRRLQYKTQVFVYHEGDHFRNRLTHTLEGAQIARTIARALGANEDLTEAIVLAHDLGHTPFGHAGERAMQQLLAEHGGFEHNRQSLRIVDWLETRSDRLRGLNLCEETRAGLLKHGAERPLHSHPVPLPALAESPSVEAQIANLADSIAYGAHDVDDGVRSGLIDAAALGALEVWQAARARANEHARGESHSVRPVIVQLVDLLVSDLIETSAARLAASGAASSAELRARPERTVALSAAGEARQRELARFLRHALYQHPQVLRMTAKGQRILSELWTAYSQEPRLLPPGVPARVGDEPLERAIADYLAGMTDRFAMDEHRKLFDPHVPV
jgi:dGTPase